MKDYRVGVIFCRCSNRMRNGKRIKIYKDEKKKVECLNCGKKYKV